MEFGYAGVTLWFLCPGAVLVFLPGLAEIKMLYEQLQSNRMFNNRGSTRSVSEGVCVFFLLFSIYKSYIASKFIFCGVSYLHFL